MALIQVVRTDAPAFLHELHHAVVGNAQLKKRLRELSCRPLSKTVEASARLRQTQRMAATRASTWGGWRFDAGR